MQELVKILMVVAVGALGAGFALNQSAEGAKRVAAMRAYLRSQEGMRVAVASVAGVAAALIVYHSLVK